jgi:predicted DNA-binding transcriptional regulator YafY
MARGDQLARQWTIIQSLQADLNGKTVSDLADVLDCHTRTVYRDLEALQMAGFPIYTDRLEGATRWYLMESARPQVPIPFSLTELMALYFSRDLLQVLKGTVLFEALESLFHKIHTTLPPETENYLNAFQQSVKVGTHPRQSAPAQGAAFEDINHAISARTILSIEYFTMSRQRAGARKVAPYRLWFFNGAFYLIAYCYKRKDVRIFALDRIRSLTPTSETFTPPASLDMEALMAASFGVFTGEAVTVRVRFSSQVAGYIQEKIWHRSQRLFPQADGGVIFESDVAGTQEIKHWIMQWGQEAEVLSPKRLRAAVRREARSMAACYEND